MGRSVADASLSAIRSQLDYKCQRAGKRLIPIDRWFPSSKTCSKCQAITKLDRSEREFHCSNSNCGYVADRDDNAATNIRAAGLAVLACGGDVRPKAPRRPTQPRRNRKALGGDPGNLGPLGPQRKSTLNEMKMGTAHFTLIPLGVALLVEGDTPT